MSKTTIALEKTTVEKLRDLGRKGQTYDDVVNGLLAHEPCLKIQKANAS